MSFTANETVVPEASDMKIGGSNPSTEDSDTTWQIVDANENAPMLSKQDGHSASDPAKNSILT